MSFLQGVIVGFLAGAIATVLVGVAYIASKLTDD